MPTLTAKFVESLKPPAAGRLEVVDDSLRGFSIRITHKGAMSWAVRYRIRGEKDQKRFTIGPYPAISLAKARERAREILEAAYGGVDLIAKEDAEKVSTQTRRLGTLAEDYAMYYKAHYRENSVRACNNEMKHLLRMLGEDSDAQNVDVGAIKEKIKELKKQYPTVANRVFTRMKAFYSWASENEKIVQNPVIALTFKGMEKQGVVSREEAGDRILTEDELRRVLKAAQLMGYPYGSYFIMLITTGQRRVEVQGMPWSEYDESTGDWLIPASRYKTKKRHLVPLPRQTREFLSDLRKMSDFPYVFMASRSLKKPISLTSLVDAKTKIDQLCGVRDWVPHDLRRTMRTGLSRLGVDRDTAERVIGHSVGSGIVKVYDHYEFREQKAAALQKWADYTDTLR